MRKMELKNNRKNIYKAILILGLAVAFGLLYAYTQFGSAGFRQRLAREIPRKGKNEVSIATAVSTRDFDLEVLKATTPVLVDFWAPWCMPCRMLAPVVDELAADYNGRVKVVKVNVDENQPLAARYGIRGIPTLLLFKNGEAVDRAVGVQPKQALVEKLNRVLED